MAEFRTAKIERHHSADFLEKAEQFHNGMIDSMQRGDYAQACSSAIHCVISSCDAVTAFHLGLKSNSQRHEDQAQLVRRLTIPDAFEKSRQISQVISAKSRIEYSTEMPSQKQALTLTLQAERIYKWA
ncbi:MAG: hypothetical protein WC408_01170 [Candidatus Micrarchaeia archaeon]|jgi:hypothetical protein